MVRIDFDEGELRDLVILLSIYEKNVRPNIVHRIINIYDNYVKLKFENSKSE